MRNVGRIYIWEGNWTEQDVKDNPEFIFVFGDNMLKEGRGGQAVIRDCSNSVGLRTKIKPSMEKNAFFSDNKKSFTIVSNDLRRIEDLLFLDNDIILSQNGYGNGLAKLPSKAPKLYRYLNLNLKILISIYGNKEELKSLKF